ncbi:MarR family winged helix-turn-helix transcriptional regulator [Agarilytica rhodophyticola]|uniref:MarR family winged helix-turn-helix transcriptional regulator n=1 Tax=Agarilytica rhodophyticola TaxID=1737490 RepID=UPI000B344379|nr:MarR family winged helix-turn-helix transcriptional regulator [Agarilytica rhodophyticola]
MFDGCIYFNIATVNRQITKIWQDEFALVGLSPSHGYLLMAIAENPGASQKEMREMMELDASTITRFIDALVSKKLIAREGSGKGSAIVLTANGNNTVKKLQKVSLRLREKMMGIIGNGEFEDIINTLHQVKRNLNASET